ncbi:hypothetical protein DMH25_22880 [Streptomyces sp. WAC 01325]|uniref:hypothetical protein n=1 Tax=Streptomyces sp. WAC 01325 TaxID=2203202 RepID=UPI000F87E363|nr:hypothetical protein [Streptomyces sp. WAC 01325]RSN03373.1 hypothetical protein DMH25_22880 [Streptomyces sp. WAC 01325]
MEQHRELINGQWIRTQRILYGTGADLAAAGIRTRDVTSMDWYRIPDADHAPSCDVKGCTELPDYRVTKSVGLFKRPKQYFGCPEHLDTCRAAMAYGHSGDPA